MDFWTSTLSWIKENVKYSLMGLLATSAILLIPKDFFPQFLLGRVREIYGPIISIFFFLCASSVLIALMSFGKNKISEIVEDVRLIQKFEEIEAKELEAKEKREKAILEYIDELTGAEKAILSYFISIRTRKYDLIPFDGNLINLTKQGILQKTSQSPTTRDGKYQFTIPKWIFEYLCDNPHKVLSELQLRSFQR